MKEKFNKREYDNKFLKENYKQFKVWLKNDEYTDLEKKLAHEDLKKSDFLRLAIKNIEFLIKLKK